MDPVFELETELATQYNTGNVVATTYGQFLSSWLLGKKGNRKEVWLGD